jgi:hypothetical protein
MVCPGSNGYRVPLIDMLPWGIDCSFPAGGITRPILAVLRLQKPTAKYL